jgi:hypothetical protein
MKAVITLLCMLSSALLGGGGFTVDGLDYEITSFNPNEVSLNGGTITNPFSIPRDVTDQGGTYRVVEIGSGAFEDTPGLTSVTLPESMREIESQAFFNTGLTEVVALGTIPPSVEADSFGDRSAIDLTVPSGTEEAYVNNGWTGFASINGISSITFEVDAITYGINSFSENTVSIISSTLTGSLNIPETVTFDEIVYTVTAIVGAAFKESQFTSVTMPNTIIMIGSEAFRGNQLTSATLSNTITTIGDNAFRDNQLSSVVLSNSILTIENDAFRNNQLTNVVLPNMLTTLGQRAFRNNQLEIISIPSSLMVLESDIFSNNNLTDITIPEGISSIGTFVFDNNNLTNITIPSSVTAINSFAFTSNPLIEMDVLATVPPFINSSQFAFGNLGSIDLTVPDGTEAAYEAAGWTGFRSVNGVVTLSVGVTFTEGDFSYTVTSLAPNELEITGGTTVSQNLLIPDNVTSQDIDFVITSVGVNAFENMGITSVQLPNTIRNIRVDAFRLNQLTAIDLPNSVTTIGNRAFEVNDISTVVIPPNVVSIGNNTFRSNELTSVTLPEGLLSLGNDTFRSNLLTTVILPANLTTMGQRAFRGNPLTEVTALGITPPNVITGSNDSFDGRASINLFVPVATAQAYLDGGWTGFHSITEGSPTIVIVPKVFLQGAAQNPIAGEEDLMRDSLRENGLLPTTSPFGDGATVSLTVFNIIGANAIVDWVLVELRSGVDNENTTLVNSTSALLQRDGDIVGLNGITTVTFQEDADDYFIAIKHRNHIGVLAAVPASLSSTASTLDITQDAAFAKGENLALTTLVNGTVAMIAGDADGSSQILNTDINEGLSQAGGGEAYTTADADMNGFVLNTDVQLLILVNSGTVQQFE